MSPTPEDKVLALARQKGLQHLGGGRMAAFGFLEYADPNPAKHQFYEELERGVEFRAKVRRRPQSAPSQRPRSAPSTRATRLREELAQFRKANESGEWANFARGRGPERPKSALAGGRAPKHRDDFRAQFAVGETWADWPSPERSLHDPLKSCPLRPRRNEARVPWAFEPHQRPPAALPPRGIVERGPSGRNGGEAGVACRAKSPGGRWGLAVAHFDAERTDWTRDFVRAGGWERRPE